ncbi:uncharacterized protein LOC110464456 [Mizuhopecten yessoensis]|uniref:uncharacterized protein LOC110464456 n=1 Tax=Mizuhopecten yessoensis TaxID=6573 RepID=UPI000B4593A3|nr:uncharacterized protein LOC110464456 [Mizuhopecten yessoensis]
MAKRMWSIGVLLVICMRTNVSGHADVVDPPSRGLMEGYHTPWGVNCGGLSKQTSNGGKCGPCGDDFTQSVPRDMEEGGKYGKQMKLGKVYNEGEEISVVIRVTANHKGFFDFKLCPSQNIQRRTIELEECLAEYPLDIIDTNAGTRGKKWPLGEGTGEITHLKVVLPTGVTCAHCVLRWDWIGGNNCCGNPQEEFRNCMDIGIKGDPNKTPAPTTLAPTAAPTRSPIVTSCPANFVLECMSVPPLPRIDCVNDWCNDQCSAKTTECTSDRCECKCEMRDRNCTFVHPRYSSLISDSDAWCNAMCSRGACSKAHCNCIYY